jgi:hypothetical protein
MHFWWVELQATKVVNVLIHLRDENNLIAPDVLKHSRRQS